MHRRLLSLVGIAYLVVSLAGCNNAPAVKKHDDHDHAHGKHDEHHETYASAVREVQELRDKIRDGFAAKKEKEADEALHEVGHLLEEIPELAEKEHFAAADLLAIKAASKALFDHFGAIDKKIHGGEGSTYAELATKIDAALEQLTQRIGKQAKS